MTPEDAPIPVRIHTFHPKGDLTLPELVQFLRFLEIKFNEQAFDKIPEELKRHFYTTYTK